MELEVLEGWAGAFRLKRPETREELWRWLGLYADLIVPKEGVCAGHQTPLDYLEYVFFEGKGGGAEGHRRDADGTSGDAVLWACRGGGKTMVGAAATLLDLLFKPGIQVRILGGSLEQSERMYGYLRGMFERKFHRELEGEATRKGLRLKNGSGVEILAQSDRSVRGQRVQKVRCDEVELFDEKVWSAAQLTTRTLNDEKGVVVARGSVEAMSTMHVAGGLMERVVGEGDLARRRFKWCVWDVIGKCKEEVRKCEGCSLWKDCGGIARRADGFLGVEDVMGMQGRVSRGVWEEEMLCVVPRVKGRVFEGFGMGHVREFGREKMMAVGEVVMDGRRRLKLEKVVAGVDFGRGTFVCMWLAMMRDEAGRRVAWVVDEHVGERWTVAENAGVMREREEQATAWRPRVGVVYCDVAGRAENSQTGRTDESVLREAGFKVKSRGMRVEEGIGVIQAMVEPADGSEARLLVDGRCVRTVAALKGYRMDGRRVPVKDGEHDHVADALRYAVVGSEGRGGKVEVGVY